MKPGDVVEIPGRRLLVVTQERVRQVCEDIQVWWWDEWGWKRSLTPQEFRNAGKFWAFIGEHWAVEIDDDKPEYVPNG